MFFVLLVILLHEMHEKINKGKMYNHNDVFGS